LQWGGQLLREVEKMENMTLSVALEKYVAIELVGCAPGTVKLMNDANKAFGKCLGRSPVIGDLNDRMISDFANWRLKNEIARATIQQNQNKLLALWRFLADEGIIAKRPRIKSISVPERTVKAWTKAELDKLFAAIKATEGMVGDVPAALWWEALHKVLWDTGERIEAIRGCLWAYLDRESKTLWVPAELRKFAKRDKQYTLRSNTVAMLEQFPKQKGVMFKWAYCEKYLYTHYKRILARAGLPVDRDSMFHRMRRSVASHIKAAGGDATAAMDHSSSKTTKGYIDLRVCPEVSPVDLLFEV
jgi:integrase